MVGGIRTSTFRQSAAAACTAVVFLVVAGCSAAKQSSSPGGPTTTVFEPALICDLIDIPLGMMSEDGTTFARLVKAPRSRSADGARAAIAFGLMARGRKQAGRYEPVLSFLQKQAAAASTSGRPDPRLTRSIEANARKLDRFVADGGCG
jgi:hypothetical protein